MSYSDKRLLMWDIYDEDIIDAIVHVAKELVVSYQIAENHMFGYYDRKSDKDFVMLSSIVNHVITHHKPDPAMLYRRKKMAEVNDFLESKRKELR